MDMRLLESEENFVRINCNLPVTYTFYLDWRSFMYRTAIFRDSLHASFDKTHSNGTRWMFPNIICMFFFSPNPWIQYFFYRILKILLFNDAEHERGDKE